MQNFKIGDKVLYVQGAPLVGEIVAMFDEYVWIKDTTGSPGTYLTSGLRHVLPTPPEGREVETEMRCPKDGDTYWNSMHKKWVKSYGDFTESMYHVLRPLPPKPKGEGWEWRMPVDGDEYQMLDTNHSPEGIAFVDGGYRPIDYRWCREKPKAKRWNSKLFITGYKLGMSDYPIIDTGTGPQLDIDTIVENKWRTKAIEWLEGKTDYASAKHFIGILREELETQ